MVVAADGAGDIGAQAGTATRSFTTGTYTSATHTGVVATTAAIRVTVRLAIPAIALPATLVTGPAIRGIVHRVATPVMGVLRPQLFPRPATRAIVLATEGGRPPSTLPANPGNRPGNNPGTRPGGGGFNSAGQSRNPGPARPRPRAPVRTRLAAISARRHRMHLLLSRRGPTLCPVQAEGVRKVHAEAKAWVAAAVGEAGLVSSERPREFL